MKYCKVVKLRHYVEAKKSRIKPITRVPPYPRVGSIVAPRSLNGHTGNLTLTPWYSLCRLEFNDSFWLINWWWVFWWNIRLWCSLFGSMGFAKNKRARCKKLFLWQILNISGKIRISLLFRNVNLTAYSVTPYHK